MRRAKALLAAMLAGLPVIALCCRVLRRQPPAARGPNVLRDAIGGDAGADLARLHAGLAEGGTPGCALCHVPRRSAPIKPAWTGGLTARLTGIASRAGLPGPAADQVAEVPAAKAKEAAYAAVPSSVCLSCHDGTFGKGGASSWHGGSHPIGVDYRLAMASDPSAYKPPDGGREIRLEDGATVGCISCHQLHGPSAGLSQAGVRKDSCQACHRI